MSGGHVVAVVLLVVAVAVVVLSAVGLLLLDDPLPSLHLLSPVTSLAVPLFGIALALQNGRTLATAQVLVTVAIVAGTAPALTAATGRLVGERSGLVPDEGQAADEGQSADEGERR